MTKLATEHGDGRDAGITGFKPSHGPVPLAGALDLVPSCDHAGVLARSVAAMVALGAADCARPPRVGPAVRLAVPRAYLDGALTTEVRQAFDALLMTLEDAGAAMSEVRLDIGDAAAQYAPLRAKSVLVRRHALETEPGSFGADVLAALGRGLTARALAVGRWTEGRIRG